MRKSLSAAALGATLLLGGPALAAEAAPSTSATPVATATATATESATSTATATESTTEQTTVNNTTTVTKHDRTGLWGLLGLLGLGGLLGGRKRREPEHHVERRTTVAPTQRAETRHVDHVDNPVRTTDVHADADDVRLRKAGEVRDDLRNDGRNI